MEEEVVEISRNKDGEKTAVAGKLVLKIWIYNGKFYIDGHALNACGLGDMVKSSVNYLYEISEQKLVVARILYALDHHNENPKMEYFDLPEASVDLIYKPLNDNLGTSKGR